MGNPLDLIRDALNKGRSQRWNNAVDRVRLFDRSLRPTTLEGWANGSPVIRPIGGRPASFGALVTSNGVIPLDEPACVDYAEGLVRIDGIPHIKRVEEEEEVIEPIGSIKHCLGWATLTRTTLQNESSIESIAYDLKLFYKENNQDAIEIVQRSWFRPGGADTEFYINEPDTSNPTVNLQIISKTESLIELIYYERKSKIFSGGSDLADVRTTIETYVVVNGNQSRLLSVFQDTDETEGLNTQIDGIPDRTGSYGRYKTGFPLLFNTSLFQKPEPEPSVYNINVRRDFWIYPQFPPTFNFIGSDGLTYSIEWVDNPGFSAPFSGYYWRDPDGFNGYESVTISDLGSRRIFVPVISSGVRGFPIGRLLRTSSDRYAIATLVYDATNEATIDTIMDIVSSTDTRMVFPASTQMELAEVDYRVKATDAYTNVPWTQKEGLYRNVGGFKFEPGEDPLFRAPLNLSNSEINRSTRFAVRFKAALVFS